MKNLISRTWDAARHGQLLIFEDGTEEFDLGGTQTTPILTAELYNGKAAKNDAGEWVPAPGARSHAYTYTLKGFEVGITMIGVDSDNKCIWDYSVRTPTGVYFHGDGKGNTLRAPSSWSQNRIALELAWWMCLGEDSGAEFPESTTEEQWAWIRSDEREAAYIDLDEMMNDHDNGDVPDEDLAEEEQATEEEAQAVSHEDITAGKVEILAKRYLDNLIHQNQSGLVLWVLNQGSDASEPPFTWEDITNLTPNADDMGGEAAAEYINDVLGGDWRSLIDMNDHDGGDVEPSDLADADVEILRDHIRDNADMNEVYEWWLVDEWLATQLEEIGESTLTDGWNHWWGRRCTGQGILQDGTLQKVAAKFTHYLD